jgi:flagellar basal-body rod protein FlgB
MWENTLALQTIEIGKIALDGSALRAAVIANNIANVDTPGFKRSEVRFEEALRNWLKKQEENTTQEKVSLDDIQPYIVTEEATYTRNDLNNVDINEEMVSLVKNQIYFESLITMLRKRLELLKLAAGRRL